MQIKKKIVQLLPCAIMICKLHGVPLNFANPPPPHPHKKPRVLAIKEACQQAVGVKCPPKPHEISLKEDWRHSDR